MVIEGKQVFIEIHKVQNVPPSLLNQDDAGAPKKATFGRVSRARISSQCWKRAIRTSPLFSAAIDVPTAIRTRHLIEKELLPRVSRAGKSQEEADIVLARLVTAYASRVEEQVTVVPLYLARYEIERLAQIAIDHWDRLLDEDGGEEAADALGNDLIVNHQDVTDAPDLALFGRMMAQKPRLGLHSASQVAHVLSTHEVVTEVDFFTAVDDLHTVGSAMMGDTIFTSACLYFYARIDWQQLLRNLGGEVGLALQTVEGFLRAAALAEPSGKQSSFAVHTPPSFLLGVVRINGQAWNLANSFVPAIRPGRNTGIIADSVAALDRYWGVLADAWGTAAIAGTYAVVADPNIALDQLKEAVVEGGLDGWVAAITAVLEGGGE